MITGEALNWLAQFWIAEQPNQPDRYPDAVSYLGLSKGEPGPLWYAIESAILGIIPEKTCGYFRIPSDVPLPRASSCQRVARGAPIPARQAPRRRIIRNEAILAGRWHLEGTEITVAAIRADFACGGIEAIERIYRRLGVSREELFAALAFTYPEIQAPQLQAQYAAISVACSCGERADGTLSGHESISLICICGRTWTCHMWLQAGDPDPNTPMASLVTLFDPQAPTPQPRKPPE